MISAVTFVLYQVFSIYLQVTDGQKDSLQGLLGVDFVKRVLPVEKRALKGNKGKVNSKDSCSLCINGGSFTNPDVYIPGLENVTCSQVDSFLHEFGKASDSQCNEVQNIWGGLCGCAPCPGICSKGEKIAFPDKTVPYDVNGNGIYDDTCGDLDSHLTLAPNGNKACFEGSFAAEHCGCKSSRSVCTPCYNNAVMPDYNKFVNELNMTCGNVAFITVNETASGTFACDTKQSKNALMCDCPSLAPSWKSSCTLCFPNETLSTSSDIVLGWILNWTCQGWNNYAMYEGSIFASNSCGTRDFINYAMEMTEEDGREACCIPKHPKKGKGSKAGKKGSVEEYEAVANELKSKIARMKKMK